MNIMHLGASVQLVLKSYLKEEGWFLSFRSKESVDKNGQPLPWYTYSFIHFLSPKLRPEFEVFEYGCGNSTRWYAAKVRHITAVEHNSIWAEKVAELLPDNAKILNASANSKIDYAKAILLENKKFDVVVIDGIERVESCKNAIKALKPKGVIVFDNSDREAYQEAYNLLIDNGFRRIDFYGNGAIGAHAWATSLFYRSENCFQL